MEAFATGLWRNPSLNQGRNEDTVTSFMWFGGKHPEAELHEELAACFYSHGLYSSDTRFIRAEWGERLKVQGWVPDLKVGQSNLKLGYKRGKVGLAIQLGNVARFHSDLLKFATLVHDGTIDACVLAVPSDSYSKELGSNHASYSKCERDLNLFHPILGAPILLMEVEGG